MGLLGGSDVRESACNAGDSQSHLFMGNRWGNSDRLYFLGLQKSLQMVNAAMKLKDIYSLEEKL